MGLNVGILSTSHVHTDIYAGVLAGMDDVDLIGVADDDEQAGRETATKHGTTYRETDALLAEADAVVVCSPNATHIDWVREAADAGVDVLCEKPLADDYETAREIADLCADADIAAGLCMPLRFSPLARETKAAYDDGKIGDLRYITGTNRGKNPGDWFVDEELSGGGAVMDHTVHILNFVRWVTDLEVVEVYAETDTRFHDISVEDVNVLSMELEDGTPFTLDGSWSVPDEWDQWGDATVEMLGTNGTVGFDSTELSMKLTRDGDDPGISAVGFGADSNEGLIQDFVDAVREDRDPMTTVADGAREVAVVEAAYRSAEQAEPVEVEY